MAMRGTLRMNPSTKAAKLSWSKSMAKNFPSDKTAAVGSEPVVGVAAYGPKHRAGRSEADRASTIRAAGTKWKRRRRWRVMVILGCVQSARRRTDTSTLDGAIGLSAKNIGCGGASALTCSRLGIMKPNRSSGAIVRKLVLIHSRTSNHFIERLKVF